MVHLGPKPPQPRKATFNDVSPDLLTALNGLEGEFTVSAERLKIIVNHFVEELAKGLSKKGGNIPMIPAWVMGYPTGKETGDYLAMDMGGTNLRVALVKLQGEGKFDVTQSKYRLPEGIQTSQDRNELFDFLAESLDSFIKDCFPNGVEGKVPLGFTFSYPASQTRINEAILQRWTKGFDIPNVEGHDIVPLLQEKLDERKTPIDLVAVINDTVGTLVASLYTDPETLMGCIFGTGVNGAFYEITSDIEKLEGKLPEDIPFNDHTLMAINPEYGSFDNEHLVLPRTKYDIQIDRESPRPGQQAFEKMTAGYYLGELLRLIMLDLHSQGLMLQNSDLTKLNQPYVMDASYPSRIQVDPFDNLEDTEKLLREDLGLKTTLPERKVIRRVCELIGIRASRLSACGIGAGCTKRGYKKGHIASDGSLYRLYPGFVEGVHGALRDIFDWPEEEDYHNYPITVVDAEDGSGVGAAIIACLTQQRLANGQSVGEKN